MDQANVGRPEPNLSGVLPREGLRRVSWALALALSALCTWLFVRKLEVTELMTLPGRVSYGFVALAAFVFLLEIPLRALRWRLLLSPQKILPLRALASVILMGFTANNLLPARAGEVVRPALAARRFGLPFVAVLVTTFLERLLDLMGLCAMLVVMALLLPHQGLPAKVADFAWELERLGLLLGGLGLLGLGAVFVLARGGDRSRRLVERMLRWLPERPRGFFAGLYGALEQGLRAFRSPWALLAACLMSVPIWLNGAMALWIMMAAFELALPFSAACFVSAALALAVVLPQAPGFVGVWQMAVSEALVLWDVRAASAQGFAMLFWLTYFSLTTGLGLALLWGAGLRLKGLWRDPSAELEKPALDAGMSAPAET